MESYIIFRAELNEIWWQNEKWPESVQNGRQIQDGRHILTQCSFCDKFMKVGNLIYFFVLNWMRYGYKMRNDQKVSKMAAKSKMAAIYWPSVVFVISLWKLGILNIFSCQIEWDMATNWEMTRKGSKWPPNPRWPTKSIF